MATHTAPFHPHRRRETDSGAFFKVAAVLLGILVSVLGMFALLMWADARENDNAAEVAVTALNQGTQTPAATGQATDHNTALPLDSFAGVVPENAAELAEAHAATDATLPPVPACDPVKVKLMLKDMVDEVEHGVKYNTR